jgi:hypothetical protein
MLGLKLLKKVGAKQIMVRGDFELIIKQIKVSMQQNIPGLELIGMLFWMPFNVSLKLICR